MMRQEADVPVYVRISLPYLSFPLLFATCINLLLDIVPNLEPYIFLILVTRYHAKTLKEVSVMSLVSHCGTDCKTLTRTAFL
jgi:hypothetical protein